jgi:hypothetical protein
MTGVVTMAYGVGMRDLRFIGLGLSLVAHQAIVVILKTTGVF